MANTVLLLPFLTATTAAAAAAPTELLCNFQRSPALGVPVSVAANRQCSRSSTTSLVVPLHPHRVYYLHPADTRCPPTATHEPREAWTARVLVGGAFVRHRHRSCSDRIPAGCDCGQWRHRLGLWEGVFIEQVRRCISERRVWV